MSVAFSPDGRRKRDLVVCLLRTADAANDREARRHLLRAKSILEVLSQEQPNPIDLSLMAALNHTLKEQHVRCFIVHGHDDVAKLELKNYLQNNLRLPEPVILHEAAAYGRTLVEKFEHYAREVNLVFVILSPDDMMAGSDVYRAAKCYL